MKFVKWLIILVAVMLGLFLVITFFLPRDYTVERSIEIEAPQSLIYSQVVDLEKWQEWNPWNEMDPEIVIEYGEKTSGEGASYIWESEVAGDGAMKIIEAAPDEYVRYELIFEGYEEVPSYSSIYISPGGENAPSTVRWTFEGSVGDSYFARWMSVMVDKFVGPSYERGLEALKERCETLSDEGEAAPGKSTAA